MPTLKQQGTEFTFSVLPPEEDWNGYWVTTKLVIKNKFINYEEIGERFTVEEMEKFICLIARLLAGAFSKEYAFATEKSGFAADFYPYLEAEREVSRERRRSEDCVMALRLLFKDETDKFLSGIYTLLLHREELKTLWRQLSEEFEENYGAFAPTRGKYLFAAVSPQGYRGCKYWYLDPTKSARKGDYVWVRMGRHDTEQIVYVDDVRYFDDEDAPYDPARVKKVLRKATDKEIVLLKWPANGR